MTQIIMEKWSESTLSDLRDSCSDDVDFIRTDVEKGLAHLYHIVDKGVSVWAVTRTEAIKGGTELVVMCVGGKGMRKAGKALIAAGKKNGFISIRYHTKNEAVARLYSMYGFMGHELERVYRLPLSEGVV